MDDGCGTGTADMNMIYLILGYMQKKTIVSMCHGSGTGRRECRYEHEILHSWFHAEGDDCFNVSWKWNWDCRYEHEIPYSWLHLEMIVSRRWRLMNIRHTFYSSFPPNIK